MNIEQLKKAVDEGKAIADTARLKFGLELYGAGLRVLGSEYLKDDQVVVSMETYKALKHYIDKRIKSP